MGGGRHVGGPTDGSPTAVGPIQLCQSSTQAGHALAIPSGKEFGTCTLPLTNMDVEKKKIHFHVGGSICGRTRVITA